MSDVNDRFFISYNDRFFSVVEVKSNMVLIKSESAVCFALSLKALCSVLSLDGDDIDALIGKIKEDGAADEEIKLIKRFAY